MTDEEQLLVQGIKEVTGVEPVITIEASDSGRQSFLVYSYKDKNGVDQARTVPFVKATNSQGSPIREDERLLLTLRKALMGARQDHIP